MHLRGRSAERMDCDVSRWTLTRNPFLEWRLGTTATSALPYA
jgi:hypothetical protein